MPRDTIETEDGQVVPTTITGKPDQRSVMSDELRQRREETFERLYINDEPHGEVCDDLAAKYGVSRKTIESDIAEMDSWLPKLSPATESGAARLRELERNQKRRRELLRELREEKEKPPEESDYSRGRELKLLNQLDQAATLYVDVAQSLGAIEREPQEHVTRHEGTVNHELSDHQREQLSALRSSAREQVPERGSDGVIEVDSTDVTDGEEADAAPPDTDTETETESDETPEPQA